MFKDKETILVREMIQETIHEMIQEEELIPFPWMFQDKLVAIGKVDSDGTLLRGTRGITVSCINHPTDGMYKVLLPEGLVQSRDYIVQLTAENFLDDADYHPTMIGLQLQGRGAFFVFIWARPLTDDGFRKVRTPWSFAIYDRKPRFGVWNDPRIAI